MRPDQRAIYGRRHGPRMSAAHKRRLDELLPRLSVAMPPKGEPLRLDDDRPLWLEIGFGGGEHLAWQAKANPDALLLGVEPFISGVAKVLGQVEEDGLDNIRLVADDARLVLQALEDRSVARAFVLFPDPWPKARHNKRRIVNDWSVAELARVLQPGAELRIATDDPGYLHWILDVMMRSPAFEWTAERADDWRVRPDDWPPTRYEAKALRAGRTPAFLSYRRRA